MSTVGKAITLLEAFEVQRPELGLTELAKIVGFDKATTRRLLLSLAAGGLIEQDESSRLYRLGPATVRFARIREAHFPFLESARSFVVALAEETGETAHLSEFDADFLTSTYVEESAQPNRISVSIGDRFPLHATASGIAYLAFTKPDYARTYLARKLDKHSPFTVTDPEKLFAMLDETRERGYSISDQGRAEGVFSVGAAVVDREGYAIGALSVASPLARVSEETAQRHGEAVLVAAQKISARLNGRSVPFASRSAVKDKVA
ncbi:IclR family transcriptional regulator [Paradevosia shaoguanensis]|uniref:IclR family transcriptional regulator n=1 Tax=Paradevosia shaoguanensis TaxID=1335043 RepID=UPI00193428D2|nr:IclR family transcriptional regulator [Paradevosia shaoguanensis]